jgi:hypothetical protein
MIRYASHAHSTTSQYYMPLPNKRWSRDGAFLKTWKILVVMVYVLRSSKFELGLGVSCYRVNLTYVISLLLFLCVLESSSSIGFSLG